MDMIFIDFSFLKTWNETLPDTRTVKPHIKWVSPRIPVIEIAYHRYVSGIGSPNSKIITFLIKHLCLMRAKTLIQPVMTAMLKIIDILLGKERIIPYRACTVNKMDFLVFLNPHVLCSVVHG